MKDAFQFLKQIGAFGGLWWLVQLVWRLYANRLTHREKELLVAAEGHDSQIKHMRLPGQAMQWIRAGSRDLGNKAVPSVEFIDALDRLVARGLVRSVSEDVYCLSGRGISVAKALANSVEVASIPCEQGK